MKVFLCILGVVLATACVNCRMSEEIEQALKECHTELGMPDVKPKGPPNRNDPKIKCFFACVMKKTGKMIDGKIDVDKEVEFAKKNTVPEHLIERVTECVEIANEQSDECEVAGAMRQCMLEKTRRLP